MADKKPAFEKGQKVLIQGWGYTMPAVVTEKTSGGTTRVTTTDGQSMLVSNQALKER